MACAGGLGEGTPDILMHAGGLRPPPPTRSNTHSLDARSLAQVLTDERIDGMEPFLQQLQPIFTAASMQRSAAALTALLRQRQLQQWMAALNEAVPPATLSRWCSALDSTVSAQRVRVAFDAVGELLGPKQRLRRALLLLKAAPGHSRGSGSGRMRSADALVAEASAQLRVLGALLLAPEGKHAGALLGKLAAAADALHAPDVLEPLTAAMHRLMSKPRIVAGAAAALDAALPQLPAVDAAAVEAGASAWDVAASSSWDDMASAPHMQGAGAAAGEHYNAAGSAGSVAAAAVQLPEGLYCSLTGGRDVPVVLTTSDEEDEMGREGAEAHVPRAASRAATLRGGGALLLTVGAGAGAAPGMGALAPGMAPHTAAGAPGRLALALAAASVVSEAGVRLAVGAAGTTVAGVGGQQAVEALAEALLALAAHTKTEGTAGGAAGGGAAAAVGRLARRVHDASRAARAAGELWWRFHLAVALRKGGGGAAAGRQG